MREKIVAANWKMYKTPADSADFFKNFNTLIPRTFQKNIFIFPPMVCIEAVKHETKSSDFLIGGQNCYTQKEGAFTGETSAYTLKTMGCQTVLIGHSERRTLFFETDELIAQKLGAVTEQNLIPLFCIGETLEERKNKKTFDVLKRQIEVGLKQFDRKHLVIAYEPVWAIGTGEVATANQAQEAHHFIREQIRTMTGQPNYKILYGGSVKPENAKELINQPDIDGFLVGGASLKPESFAEICNIALQD